jgi:dUTP pyrophosphatase
MDQNSSAMNMNTINVKVKKLDSYDENLALPSYQTALAAGADVRLCLDVHQRLQSLTIKPWQRIALPTGLAFEIPAGYEIQVRPRSGLSFKTGLMLLNSPGTIDADYRGELKILMINNSPVDIVLNHGERIAQLVLSQVAIANFVLCDSELSWSERGDQGFGSTGLN